MAANEPQEVDLRISHRLLFRLRAAWSIDMQIDRRCI
jgi:hypothetical protein